MYFDASPDPYKIEFNRGPIQAVHWRPRHQDGR